MLSQRNTTNRELLLLLVAMILLAALVRIGEPVAATGDAELAATASSAATTYALDAAGSPYWTAAHAFPRKPVPVYSDVQGAPATPQ